METDGPDRVEEAARIRESLAHTLEQVRAETPPAGDPPPPETGPATSPKVSREVKALLARTRSVIEQTRRVIEQTRKTIGGGRED